MKTLNILFWILLTIICPKQGLEEIEECRKPN